MKLTRTRFEDFSTTSVAARASDDSGSAGGGEEVRP